MIFHRHFLLTAAVALLLSCAFMIGVFFRGFDQAIFSPALLLIFLAGALMMVHGWRGGWSFPSAGCAVFLALFWIWTGVSLIWSTVPYISTIFTLIIGSMPLLFFATVQNPRADELIRGQMAGVMAVIVVMAAWAMIQFVFLSDLTGPRIRHPMLNPNNLAVLLTMGVFPLLLAFVKFKGVRMVAAGGLMGLVICAMLVTQSRGGILGLVAGGVLFSTLCYPVLKIEWKRFTIFVCILGVTVAALWLTMAERMDSIRVFGGGGSGTASINERFLLFQAAIRMLMDHPFPGIGLGVFYLAFPPYRHVNDVSDGFFVHVDPLQFAIEMSVIAPVLFYGFCIAVLIRTLKALKESHGNSDDRLRVIVPFCGLLALLINAHINFDLYMLPALIMAAIMLAAWYRGTENILGPARWRAIPGNHAHLIFLVPALALLFIAAPLWAIRAGIQTREAGLASIALGSGDMGAAEQHTKNALRYGLENYYRSYYLDALWRGKILQDQYDRMSPDEREALFTKAQGQLDLTLAYNPYNVQALNHKALFYYLAWQHMDEGGMDKAVALLEQAVRIDPVNFDVRIGLAMLLDRQGFPDKAIAVLEEGNQWRIVGDYAPPAYRSMLIGLKTRTDNLEEAENLKIIAHERDEVLKQKLETRSRIDLWFNDKVRKIVQ